MSEVKLMSDMAAQGKAPEILFWIGCAGSYDDRYKRVTIAFVKILQHLSIDFAVLGPEESCTGDPARRAGNEFLFQMQAASNIQLLNTYNVKKIVTACPHCFNTFKNEYPELGGNYEVMHHASYLQNLINQGRIKLEGGGQFKGKKITYHDSCYLGRSNNIYEAPRKVLEILDADLIEMKRCKTKGLCCGAGGAQIFKESEKGTSEIHHQRAEEAINTGAEIVAAACPFCMLMLRDGMKHQNKEEKVKIYDLAELIAQKEGLS